MVRSVGVKPSETCMKRLREHSKRFVNELLEEKSLALRELNRRCTKGGSGVTALF
jgi:hypothetical protein